MIFSLGMLSMVIGDRYDELTEYVSSDGELNVGYYEPFLSLAYALSLMTLADTWYYDYVYDVR